MAKNEKDLELSFKILTENDFDILTMVMKRAFDDDAQKHLEVDADPLIQAEKDMTIYRKVMIASQDILGD